MARAAAAVGTETTGDGTQVIARNPALKAPGKAAGKAASERPPVDDEGRFTGHGVQGITFERRWTTPGVHPYDEIDWELRTADIANETGKTGVRAEGRRGSDVLEPARDQRRRQQVLPRSRRHARARAQRQAAHRPRGRHDHRPGRETQHYFADRRRPGRVQGRADAPARAPEDGLQQPGLVQRRLEEQPQCSACFINSVQDTMDSIMDLAKTEAMLFKYGSGSGSTCRPSARRRAALSGGGMASRPGQLHEGLRRVRGRHQVGRQDPPRGEDGHPQRRPSRHRSTSSTARLNEEKKAWALIEQGYDPASPARPTARSSSRTRTTACA